MLVDLRNIYPQCPDILKPGEMDPKGNCSLRFKLFLTLYRLKVASSFNLMERIFGWSASAIWEWFQIIVKLMFRRMNHLHDGFLNFMGSQWQLEQVEAWRHKHLMNDTLNAFVERIEVINADCAKERLANRINLETWIGSVGAADCTFSVRPRITERVLEAHGEDANADRMYTDYAKIHAYKLLILTSHSIDGSPKFVLHVGLTPGSVSDNAIYTSEFERIKLKLIAEACVLGDHAFHKCLCIIVPYTNHQIAFVSTRFDRSNFNHIHSSDRMTSEHGVNIMKQFGVVRGRDDYRMFEDENLYVQSVKVCQALHNFKMLNGLRF